ncbi:MAG: MFS transporter [Gammaproteobacteria bacterium]
MPNSLLVFVMAVACGVAVANLYYAQPLLETLAEKFGVSAGEAGLIVTMTQLGYFLGLALLVPLGDWLERRRLISLVSLGTVAALVVAAIAPNIGVFLIASLAIGFTAVVAQILVPFAAHMAVEEQRGRVVGRVMAGLLLGILLARTFSGLITSALGWRAVFWLAAAIMIIQAVVLYFMLPRYRNETHLSYPALLGSVLALFREEPLLRRRAVYGAMGFASFSVLWTALAFLLARPPYNYGEAVIGLFGLLGAAGAFCAVIAGRLHDRGLTRAGTGMFLALIVVAFAIMGIFSTQLAAIVIGVVLLDLGQQGAHILNQSVIYQLRPEARSRLTTAYMTCFFLGGVIGSAAAGYMYKYAGWTGVAWLGGAFGAVAFLFWLTEFPSRRAVRLTEERALTG